MPYPTTLGDLLLSVAQESGDAEAFRYGDERLTYADWNRLADRACRGLMAVGIDHGDIVALLLPSTPLYMALYLGAARMGAITMGINCRFRRREIHHVLHRTGARLLLAVDQWHGTDFRALVDSVTSHLPLLKDVRWVKAEEVRASTPTALESLLPDGPFKVDWRVIADDPAAIVFSSGTTGLPKGAWYSHGNIMKVAEIEMRRHSRGRIPYRKHLSAGLSFSHIGTMARVAVHIGQVFTSILHDDFDPGAVLETIEREQLEHLGGVPTQLVMLLRHPDRPKRDLSSLRSILVGGAPVSADLIDQLQAAVHATISVRYSSTEVAIATASLPGDPPEILATTVGKATPGVELRIVDDHNRPLGPGELGEICVRSAATMRGYWMAPEATARTIDSERWVHTRDLGFLDEQGYLHLKGRSSEVFIRGGYNVLPEEVESVLVSHPAVQDAAVIGVFHDVLGEIGWAFVVPRDPQSPPTLEEIRNFIGAELASFKRPDGLTIVPELPLTPMFKVDRKALQALWKVQSMRGEQL